MARGQYERKTMNRNRGGEIVSFLSKHPGMPFTAKEIQDGCSFPTGDLERSRIVAALGHLVRKGDSGIETFVRGSWTFTGKRYSDKEAKSPTAKTESTPEMLEVIGKLTDGDFVGKGDDNNVYRIKLTKL